MPYRCKNNLIVIEDAACALGATQNGKLVGSFGHFGSFSLHPRKSITSGEGGVLTTNDENTMLKVRLSGTMELIRNKLKWIS
ncbi:MAG: DegT/DnrJ/EryC1/StrS family aminotransferase [Saprospiraceae bacterium]|nr:DegT/DnrJ/EryC1/StrS family aminotransferase [Saprospiraceae bacterium]